MTFEKSRLLKKIPLIFIFFLFSIESAFTQSASYQRIVATPALAVRDSPGVDGRVLVRKYRGDRLTVYSRLEQPVIVNGIRGYWVQVDDGYLSKQEGQKGWVFSGFLSDYRNGPDSLYANALRLEKRDSQRAGVLLPISSMLQYRQTLCDLRDLSRPAEQQRQRPGELL